LLPRRALAAILADEKHMDADAFHLRTSTVEQKMIATILTIEFWSITKVTFCTFD
jgi:hypothetical protein